MALEAPRVTGGFFQHLLQLKKDVSLDTLPGYLQAGALEILSLKQVHRELCEATEVLRDATAEAKTQLDQSSLQLQNLLYEQQHYEKEIAGCRAYKSAYPDEKLELIPLGQFQQQWQGQHNKPLSDDPHQVMLDRLSHELTSREETVRQLEAVKARRDALASEVARKRSELGALETEVAKLRAAAQKVQQQFGIPQPGLGDASRRAGLLPPPLYLIYTQLAAAAAGLAADGPVVASVTVVGEVPLQDGMQRSASGPSAATGQPAGGAHEAYPLAVNLALRKTPVTNSAPSLSLTFSYIPSLNIVTVAGNRKEPKPGSSSRPADAVLLGGLYPGDDGSELPTVPGGVGGAGWDVENLPGRPYRWAQQAAGIDLLPPLPPQLYISGTAEGHGAALAAAEAALQQYIVERRAAAVLDKLIGAVVQQTGGS
ncbi:hypothetical protein N2152v2_005141 [Parachlorella kessleri]